jgi:hypothetical protein
MMMADYQSSSLTIMILFKSGAHCIKMLDGISIYLLLSMPQLVVFLQVYPKLRSVAKRF